MNEHLIDKRFEEWTKGLAAKEARVSVFEHVRDIPYAIVPELRDPSKGPCGMLEMSKGSCQPKHFLLAELFARLGIPVKFVTYPFKWLDPRIKYPPEIKKIVEKLPTTYHLACKANINSRWVLIDATWDPPLEKAGFPVIAGWDGMGDTMNAVATIEEILHENLQERIAYEAARKSLYTEDEKALYEKFIPRLNAWLDEVRHG